jgi:uncharacterized membrane protein
MRRSHAHAVAERVVAFAFSGTLALLLPGLASAQVVGPILTSRFERVGTPSSASALSANGQVIVGRSGRKAFQWNPLAGIGPVPDLPDEPLRQHTATAVSADGRVVGGYILNPPGNENPHLTTAFRTSAATGSITLEPFSVVLTMSSNGQKLLGERASPDVQAFYWTEAGIVAPLGDEEGYSEIPLAASATGSVAVGYRKLMGGTFVPRPVRWRFGFYGLVSMEILADLSGGNVGGEARGVSGNGDVVAGWSYGPNGKTAVAWFGSNAAVALGSLAGWTSSIATAVSPDGTIIVGSGITSADSEAFVWTSAKGVRPLRSVLPEPVGWRLTGAVGVTSDDTFVYFAGNAFNPDGLLEGWWARVRKPF